MLSSCCSGFRIKLRIPARRRVVQSCFALQLVVVGVVVVSSVVFESVVSSMFAVDLFLMYSVVKRLGGYRKVKQRPLLLTCWFISTPPAVAQPLASSLAFMQKFIERRRSRAGSALQSHSE